MEGRGCEQGPKARVDKAGTSGNLQDVCILGLQLLPLGKELPSLLQVPFLQLQPSQGVQVGHVVRVSLDGCREVLPGQGKPACFPLQVAQHAQSPCVVWLQLQQRVQQLTTLPTKHTGVSDTD